VLNGVAARAAHITLLAPATVEEPALRVGVVVAVDLH